MISIIQSIISTFLLGILVLFNSAVYAADSDPLSSKQQALLKLLLPSLDKNKAHQSYPHQNDLDTGFALTEAAPTLSVPLAVNQSDGLTSIISAGDLNPRLASVGGKNAKSSLVLIESLLMAGDGRHSQLLMRLDRKPFYKITTDETHQVVTLVIDEVDPRSLLSPMDLTRSVIQKIHYDYNMQRQLVITLLLAPMADVQGLRMMGDQPAEFVLEVGVGSAPSFTGGFQKAVKNEGPYRPLVKTPSIYSAQETAQYRYYRDAVNYIARNQFFQAEQILERAIHQYPLFEEARVALAEVYLRQNFPDKALSTLTSFDLGDAPIADHVDYYTVLAESYRQSGRYGEAVKIYQALLNFGPENGVWWTGLGLCLEGLGKKSDARNAFLKAQSLGNLPPELNDLVREPQ